MVPCVTFIIEFNLYITIVYSQAIKFMEWRLDVLFIDMKYILKHGNTVNSA